MVQKYQSPVRVYKYPFELVMAAYERRFPRCPQIPIVLDCEVTSEEILDNGARRNTNRRCKIAVDAPYIFKKIIGVDVVYFMQNNYLDLVNRTLNIDATNETFSSRVEIFERCRYYAHPDNPDWTCFDQTASLDIKNFFGFENSIEKMGMKQYTQTTLKGREIIEYFINELKNEGIVYVPRWQPSNNDTITNNTKSIKINDKLNEMLDGDFITKNLGQLSPMQESKLLELYERCKNSDTIEKCPSYQILLRFLRARDFHVEKAFHSIDETIKWRKENNIGNLLNDYKMPSVINEHFPGGWHHCDKDGRPMYILRLGHMDVKGLLKSVGEEGLLKLSLHICEEGMKLISKLAEELGKPVLSWCVLVDLEGLSMRHMWRPGVKALLRIIETVEKNYPETMGRVLVVRSPRVFPIAWTIVSTLIDENTRSKFLFYGGPDCLHIKDGLEQYIDPNIIPNFLGGPCKALIHEGGIIPKTLYKMNSQEEAQNGKNGNCHHDLYKTVEIKQGYIHEVVIKNNDPKSVLTWDFDVIRSDLHFTLYRTTKEVPNNKDNHISFLDLSGFEENKNCFREEPTIICRPKESIQGSHVMNTTDTYILHWFSPTASKEGTAQLMYLYEILSSANYKGSMTSLQSAFSETSSCQSR